MKKFLPYILILIIVAGIGLFGLVENVQAAGEKCWSSNAYGVWFETSYNQNECTPPKVWSSTRPTTQPATPAPEQSEFEKQVGYMECGIINGDIWPGCVIQISYGLFYQVAAFILGLSAKFFNVLITITLSSTLFAKSTFIPTAWTVVRDLSNIFFILILLYIAIKIILDLGGSEAKKMIAKVIIIALLINFSMFFTKVVIDSSNILALIFYNRVDVEVTSTDGIAVPTDAALNWGKDISGAMWKTFDATRLITDKNIKLLKTNIVDGKVTEENNLSFSLTLGIMLFAGGIMLFAAYAFFVSGLMFIGRLLELWVLIIFSPFAFMSWTVPKFASIEYLCWDACFKRLISTAFMAPIFMFFIYLIFMLLPHIYEHGGGVKPIFSRGATTTILGAILGILIPAIIVISMLLKATQFAKKGGGEFGEVLLAGAKIAGGVALGVATGGTALLARGAIGGAGGFVANKAATGTNWVGSKMGKWGNRLGVNKLASGLTSVGKATQQSSFDIRATGLGKTFASKTGISMGGPIRSIEQKNKEKVEKEKKRADELGVRADEGLKQKLNKTEADLQGLLNANSKELSDLDKLITVRRQALSDANAQFGGNSPQAEKAGRDLNNYKNRKKALKTGANYAGDIDINTGATTTTNQKDYASVNVGTYTDSAGVKHARTIDYMEDIEIRDRKHDIETENRRRRVAFAYRTNKINRWSKNLTKWGTLGITNGFDLGSNASREAAHAIIMESKIEDKK